MKTNLKFWALVSSGLLLCGIGLQLRWKANRELSTSEPVKEIANVVPPVEEKRDLKLCTNFYQSVCHHRDITSDPTGTVQPDIKGEVEALRLYEKIIHDHPTWTIEHVDEELVNTIYTEKRRKKLIDTFTYVVGRMKAFIERQSVTLFSAEEKRRLIANLEATHLELPPPISLYSDEPDLFTKNEIYYSTFSDHRRVIRVGGAYLLSVRSWFNRVFTFGHELAHAIDPCEMKSAGLSLKAYENLTQCFMTQGFIPPSQANQTCGDPNQVGEIFADWVATELAVEAITNYLPKFQKPEDRLNSVVNAVRDLCTQESWIDADTNSYPETLVRVEKVYGNHSGIQKLLGCEPKEITHCGFEGKL